MSEVTVSVVIPAYNCAAFIGRTLDGVRLQTFTRHETVVVDDGSSDGTSAVVEKYFARHGMRGRVIRQANRGIAGARNVGMCEATGSYVALLDHDDLWYPEKLAAVMEDFEQHPDVDLICHDQNTTRDGRLLRVSHRQMPRGGTLYEALLFDGNLLSPSAVIFRRDRALEIGGFDERPEYLTVEDYDFWLRFSRQWRIKFLNGVLSECVLLAGGASRRIVFHHVALERVLREHMAAYLQSHPGLGVRVRARRRMARVYRSAARHLLEQREAVEDQRSFVMRMLRSYPLEPRNVGVALIWMMATLRRRFVAVQP